ncbi:hypothetical protein AB4Z22_44260, partial [Paenibacillus sp. TAF58]
MVNNAWGGYEDYDDVDFSVPFWEQPMTRWDKMFEAGLRAQMVSSRYGYSLITLAGKDESEVDFALIERYT